LRVAALIIISLNSPLPDGTSWSESFWLSDGLGGDSVAGIVLEAFQVEVPEAILEVKIPPTDPAIWELGLGLLGGFKGVPD